MSMTLLGKEPSPEVVEFNLMLHAIRCLLLNAFAKLTPTLIPVLLAKIPDILDEFRDSRYVSRLLSMTLSDLRDLLRRGGFAGDLKIEREGTMVRIEVVKCVVARDIHRFFKVREQLCPIIEVAYLILRRHFREVRFAELPYITEDGAVGVFEVRE